MYDLKNPIEIICLISSILWILGVVIYNCIEYRKGNEINVFNILGLILMSWLIGPAFLLIAFIFIPEYLSKFFKIKRKI